MDYHYLVAKINWSFNGWKGFDWESHKRRHQSGFEFVRQTGYAHEWWNFYEGFSQEYYYGVLLRSPSPKRFRRGVILFISRNPVDKRWYLVGVYGDAEYNGERFDTGVPVREALPHQVIEEMKNIVKEGTWKEAHIEYIKKVLSGEVTFKAHVRSPKQKSLSFDPRAYIEVTPEDIGVGSMAGQWKITYKISRENTANLLERVLKRYKTNPKIENSEEATERLKKILVTMNKGNTQNTIPLVKWPVRTQKPEERALDSPLPNFPSKLLGRYEPIEFLGEGGFARVFKVKRKSDGQTVALKIPRIDERTSGLFIKEVAAWYNLNHPHIVRLYKADILPVPHLEMEFVEGVELNGKVIRDLDAYPKPVEEETALKLITGIAEGLKHAHSKGIYHLDLKPLNILLKSDLTPKITDWGLAKISARSSLSQHYGYSPPYAAPEQLDEETFGLPDHRTDIYQLGLIFYELLTGELPYSATTPGALIGKIIYGKPKKPSETNPSLAKYDGLFEKLLAKKKEDRFSSVEEFLKALNSLGELEREKEELKKTTIAMRKSRRSREELKRLKAESVRKTVRIALLSARLNDKAELLRALDDLRFETRENFDDLVRAIEQVELLLREGIPIGEETFEMLRTLLLRIEGEVLR